MLKTPEISQYDYECFQQFLEQACGILLGDGRQYLIISRLTKLMRDERLSSIAELLDAIHNRSAQHLRNAVIDAMTTNETSWFRDGSPFLLLEQHLLRSLDKNSQSPCRIWSAACSSGQEPYTLSMLISEYRRKNPDTSLARTQIIATDISSSVLEQARSACYETHALSKGLSYQRRQHFFQPAGEQWTLIDAVRNRVEFKEQNLLQSYSALGRFDMIFCRNVLIYFSADRKKDILQRLAATLNPGGYLFLGASETISGYSDAFELVRFSEGAVYQKR